MNVIFGTETAQSVVELFNTVVNNQTHRKVFGIFHTDCMNIHVKDSW